MKYGILKIAIAGLIFFSLSNYTQAAGIGVRPSKLDFELTAGSTARQKITVQNLSKEPVIYNLYADEFQEQIIIEPNNFRLEAGQSEKVFVKVSPKKAGLFATNLSVVAQDLDRRKFNVSTGLKVSLAMNVLPADNSELIGWLKKIIGPFIGLLILTAMFWLVIKKQKKSLWQKVGHQVNLLTHHKRPWWRKIL